MAGTAGRQALKKAALLALDDSRSALGVEVVRLRPMLHPAELVRQSVAKHKMMLMIGAAVAGVVVVRMLMPSGRRGERRTWRDALIGAATSSAWTMLREPLMDFAKSHFSTYLERQQNPQPPEPEIPA